VLEAALLPIAARLVRLLIRTWRTCPPTPAQLLPVRTEPRLMIATCHGMFLHLLAFSRIPAAFDRRVVVMLSPSLDGRLLAAALRYFDIDSVHATSGSRSVGGSLEFLDRVRAGAIGLVAVDGPRGPCGVAKPGTMRLAAAAGARVLVAVTGASTGLRFGSWDRSHLPLPFARVTLDLPLLPPAADGVTTLQDVLLASARRLRSPVLPPAVLGTPSASPATASGSTAPPTSRP